MNYHNKDTIHFNHITLIVKNIKQMLDFYQHNLGFFLLKVDNNHYTLGVLGKPLVTFIDNPNANIVINKNALYHFAILLPSRAHLGQFLKHLIDTKTRISGGSNHGISEAIYLNDPEYNGVEIYADINASLWNHDTTMLTLPLDYEALLNDRLKDTFTNLPKETIIGHLHLHAFNLKTAINFYQNIIGFYLILNYHNSAAFLSDHKYHHHLGLNVWKQLNDNLNPKDITGLYSYNLSYPQNKLNDLIKRFDDNEIGYKLLNNTISLKDTNNVILTINNKVD